VGDDHALAGHAAAVTRLSVLLCVRPWRLVDGGGG
jgi:hypothetical protein